MAQVPVVRVLTGDVHLRPVLELEPSHFGSADRPAGAPSSAAEEDGHWRACLRQAGLVDVAPIVPGSWLVPLEGLSRLSTLETIIRIHFTDDMPATEDEVGPLSGGYALTDGSDVLVLPTCCSDLGDLESWRAAANNANDHPEMLWIGHPWLSAWQQGPLLHLREEPEYPQPSDPAEFAVEPDKLRGAVAEAQAVVDAFRGQLELVLPSLLGLLGGALSASAVARLLVGRVGG